MSREKNKVILIVIAIIVVYLFVIPITSVAQNDSKIVIKCGGYLESSPAINFDKENNIYLMLDGKILKYNQTGTLIYKKTLDDKGSDPSFNFDSKENLHIVYRSGLSITYQKLNLEGDVIFSRKISDDSEWSDQPNVIIDLNDYIHITWLESDFDTGEVQYIKFDNIGNNLTEEKVISLDDGFSSSWGVTSCLNTAVDSDDNIHVVWDDIRDFSDYQHSTYYTKLDNNGSTIIDDKRITYKSDIRANGILIDSEDNIIIIWTYAEYNSTHTSEPSEIHFTKFNSNGEILIEDLTLVSQDSIRLPSFDIDSKNNIVIIWSGGDGTIYKIVIDNNGNILEETTEFVKGGGYNAVSFNKDDSFSVIWGDIEGSYFNLPEPIVLENNNINGNEHFSVEIYLIIGIFILVLIVIIIVFGFKRKNE